MQFIPRQILARPLQIVFAFAAGVGAELLFGIPWKTASGTDVSTLLIRGALMGMFYLICLQIRPGSLRPKKQHAVILLLNLGMGVVPYCLLRMMGWELLAQAAFFIGITPTANAAPVMMDFLRGRVGFVLTGFVITNLVVSAFLVVLLPVVAGEYSNTFVWSVLCQILLLIGLPLCAATCTRMVNPRAVEWPKRWKNFSFILWCGTLFIIASRSTEYLRDVHFPVCEVWSVLLLSLGLCVANFTLGRLCSPKRYSRESSQTLGQKNTTFTIVLALLFGGPHGAFVALGPTFYVLWHNLWNAFQLFRVEQRKFHRIREVRTGKNR